MMKCKRSLHHHHNHHLNHPLNHIHKHLNLPPNPLLQASKKGKCLVLPNQDRFKNNVDQGLIKEREVRLLIGEFYDEIVKRKWSKLIDFPLKINEKVMHEFYCIMSNIGVNIGRVISREMHKFVMTKSPTNPPKPLGFQALITTLYVYQGVNVETPPLQNLREPINLCYIDQHCRNPTEFDGEQPPIPHVIEPLNRDQMVVAFVFLYQLNVAINSLFRALMLLSTISSTQ